LPAAVWWLTLYATLLGAAAGATGAFTALFGEQELGMTRAQAGFMVGLTGGAAVIARILLSGVAQRARHYGPPLAWIALLAAASLAVTAAAPRLGVAALWLGTVGTAVTIGSWNSVAMLAAMASVPPSQAGRSSGRVMVGFLSGLGVAPPLFGAAVDRTGSYLLGWGVLLGICAVAGATMLLWWRRDQRPTEAVST
jgi:predicted MFS family arabinose efflux permease